MKLIVQIPCLNEAEHLPATLRDLPREVPGFDRVEWLVIDNDSTDGTAEAARRHGADHIIRLTNNKGLAAAFQAGLDASLKLGADVVVNTDADNQYDGRDIPRLIGPIMEGRADMVIGDREIRGRDDFSPLKRRLQQLGSVVVRRASGTTVPDTTSGFRAYNREAALQVQVVSRFTYTLETIIQAGKTLVAVEHQPIRSRPVSRTSRLFNSNWDYVRRNALGIFRVYALYEPLRVFAAAAALVGLVAAVIWGRFLYFLLSGEGSGHVQSLILGAVLFIVAVQLAALGVVGDILAGSRILQQRILERVRRVELRLGVEPSHYEPGAQPGGGEGAPRPAHAPTTGARAGPRPPEPEGEPPGGEAPQEGREPLAL